MDLTHLKRHEDCQLIPLVVVVVVLVIIIFFLTRLYLLSSKLHTIALKFWGVVIGRNRIYYSSPWS